MTDEDRYEPRDRPVGDDLRIDLDGPYVVFDDGTRAGVDGDYDCGVLPEDKTRTLRLWALDAALGAIAEDGDQPVDMWLIDTDPPVRAYEVEPLPGITLHTGGVGELCVLVDIELPRHIDEAFETQVNELLTPMMERLEAHSIAPFYGPSLFGEGNFVVMVAFKQMADRIAGDLLDMARSVRAFLMSARAGEFNRDVARDLLRAGHTQAVAGQPESGWLEAKSQTWALDTPSGKAEAAKDLTALANADGGLVLIPARTTQEGDRELIDEVRPMPLERFSETQLRDVIASWTFPPLRGVEVDVVDSGDGRGYAVISVAAHRPEDWPHLVVRDDEAAFPSAAVAAYIRDGAQNRALTAAQLHGQIRSGL